MTAMKMKTIPMADNNRGSARLPVLRQWARFTGKTILIVDDDPDTLHLFESLMEKEGYTVQTANGAESAMTFLHFFTPDAVLMDIGLPGIDGLQLTRLIREPWAAARADYRVQLGVALPSTGKARRIPILAVSATSTRATVQEAYDAGCDGYITKPVDIGTFASTVGSYLEGEGRRG
ncbi:MAG: response regulator receiver protein [Candidatus Solibacter sp.]|jgi:CheY-like chemotaxis protein|nr:response regulator receiver protein [Candidatus Solibacter sp.]